MITDDGTNKTVCNLLFYRTKLKKSNKMQLYADIYLLLI